MPSAPCSPFAAVVALFVLGACHRDECKDSQLNTSWCEGSVPTRCESNSLEGSSYNAIARSADCAERGLGCVRDGLHASCGFADRTCDPSDPQKTFCVDTWVAQCADSGHPSTGLNCADNPYGLGAFCIARHDDALCSPSNAHCDVDAGTQCVAGVLATCEGSAWVPKQPCAADGGLDAAVTPR